MKRKNWIVPTASLSLLVLACAPVHAAAGAYDGFNYATGTDALDGNSGGTGFVSPWVNADNVGSNVVAGSLSYTGLAASTGNSTAGNTNSGPVTQSQRSFLGTAQTTGTIYISELVNLAPVAAEGRTPYAANFIRVGNGSGQYGSNFTASFGFDGDYGAEGGTQQVFIDTGGFVRTGGPEGLVTAIPGGVSLNDTQLLVAELNLDTNTISLFLDPTVGAAQPMTATLTTTDANLSSGLSQLTLSADDNDAGDPATVDEVRVGTTFASVTPGPTSAVPEPASLGLITIAAAGLLGKRRHK